MSLFGLIRNFPTCNVSVKVHITSQGRLTRKIFFLHVPFPPSMIFKEMECGPEILEGMLNADVVGFHGFTDARHFLSSVKRILGVAHESFEGLWRSQ